MKNILLIVLIMFGTSLHASDTTDINLVRLNAECLKQNLAPYEQEYKLSIYFDFKYANLPYLGTLDFTEKMSPEDCNYAKTNQEPKLVVKPDGSCLYQVSGQQLEYKFMKDQSQSTGDFVFHEFGSNVPTAEVAHVIIDKQTQKQILQNGIGSTFELTETFPVYGDDESSNIIPGESISFNYLCTVKIAE